MVVYVFYIIYIQGSRAKLFNLLTNVRSIKANCEKLLPQRQIYAGKANV